MSVWIELGLTLVVAGVSYVVKRYRTKFSQIFALIDRIEKALEDGTLTEEELREIMWEIRKLSDTRWW